MQLFLMTMSSLLYLKFLTYYRPYGESILNKMEILNEMTIITCLYMSYTFTDFVIDPL